MSGAVLLLPLHASMERTRKCFFFFTLSCLYKFSSFRFKLKSFIYIFTVLTYTVAWITLFLYFDTKFIKKLRVPQ